MRSHDTEATRVKNAESFLKEKNIHIKEKKHLHPINRGMFCWLSEAAQFGVGLESVGHMTWKNIEK